jgi:hypothetical protein
MNWYKTYKSASGNIVNAEANVPKYSIWERWDNAVKGRAVIEVVKNPDSVDIAKIRSEQGYGDEIGLIITENNIYGFRRDLEFHKNVASKLGIAEYIGVLLGNGYVMVTDATTNKYRDNPDTAEVIRRMLPNIGDISYFNEAIVGNWEELETR